MANAYVSAETITLGEVIHLAIEQGYTIDVTHKDGSGRPVMIHRENFASWNPSAQFHLVKLTKDRSVKS